MKQITIIISLILLILIWVFSYFWLSEKKENSENKWNTEKVNNLWMNFESPRIKKSMKNLDENELEIVSKLKIAQESWDRNKLIELQDEIRKIIKSKQVELEKAKESWDEVEIKDLQQKIRDLRLFLRLK